MKNKFRVDNNPTSFEDSYNIEHEYASTNIAKLEIAPVAYYDRHTKTGQVYFNNSKTPFTNITELNVSPNDEVVLAYVNNTTTLVCLGIYKYNDITTVQHYSPTFTATGLTFTGTDDTYPTVKSWFTRSGNIVSFSIECDLATVTNFGTGQYKLELPYLPLPNSSNHFSGWVWDGITDPDLSKHILLNIDHLPDTKTIDLHFLVLDPSSPKPVIENIFKQGSPFTLTTDYKIFVTGTYITGEA